MATTDMKVKQVAAMPPGRHRAATNLYLCVADTGKRAWSFRYMLNGKPREMGLGSAELVTLAEARERTIDLRRALQAGVDPLAARVAAGVAKAGEAAKPTFKQVAEMVHANNLHRFSDRYGKLWMRQLEAYVFPTMGDTAIDAITYDAAEKLFQPIWLTLKSADTLRGRCEEILTYAIAKDWYAGLNPFAMAGKFGARMADRNGAFKTQSHSSLAWQETPAFLSDLTMGDAADALIAFVVLTGARFNEAAGADWSEFDFKQNTWTIPAEKMKAKRKHVVPLTAPVLALLHRQGRQLGGLVFTRDNGKPVRQQTVLERVQAAGASGWTPTRSSRPTASVPR